MRSTVSDNSDISVPTIWGKHGKHITGALCVEIVIFPVSRSSVWESVLRLAGNSEGGEWCQKCIIINNCNIASTG